MNQKQEINQKLKIVCRATAINYRAKTEATAEIVIESSDGARRSVSVNDRRDFPVAVGDKIFCLVGKIAVSVPRKPSLKLFTLSSQKIERTSTINAATVLPIIDTMIIEERIFDVMRILSK